MATMQYPNIDIHQRIAEIADTNIEELADKLAAQITELQRFVERSKKRTDLQPYQDQELERLLNSTLPEAEIVHLQNIDRSLGALLQDEPGEEFVRAVAHLPKFIEEVKDSRLAIDAAIAAYGTGNLMDQAVLGKLHEARDNADGIMKILAIALLPDIRKKVPTDLLHPLHRDMGAAAAAIESETKLHERFAQMKPFFETYGEKGAQADRHENDHPYAQYLSMAKQAYAAEGSLEANQSAHSSARNKDRKGFRRALAATAAIASIASLGTAAYFSEEITDMKESLKKGSKTPTPKEQAANPGEHYHPPTNDLSGQKALLEKWAQKNHGIVKSS